LGVLPDSFLLALDSMNTTVCPAQINARQSVCGELWAKRRRAYAFIEAMMFYGKDLTIIWASGSARKPLNHSFQQH